MSVMYEEADYLHYCQHQCDIEIAKLQGERDQAVAKELVWKSQLMAFKKKYVQPVVNLDAAELIEESARCASRIEAIVRLQQDQVRRIEEEARAFAEETAWRVKKRRVCPPPPDCLVCLTATVPGEV